MNGYKRELMPLYSYYDRSGIARHLEQMAAKGWMLDRLGGWSWRYRRAEPQRLRFSITYFPSASQYDPRPSEGLETLRDYCAQAGWTLAADNAQVQIFYSSDPDAVPLETDPAAELANIRATMRKSFLPSWLALLLLALLQEGMLLWQLIVRPHPTALLPQCPHLPGGMDPIGRAADGRAAPLLPLEAAGRPGR